MSQSDKLTKIANDRKYADQGDFFFAKPRLSNGKIEPHPVFVLGKHSDSNDDEDVVVCSCTKYPARTQYDIPVNLKLPTSVRTNKIYTIRKDQMEFKINHNVSPEVINEIILSASKAIQCK